MKRMPSGGEYRQTLEDAKGMRKGDAPRECAKGMRKEMQFRKYLKKKLRESGKTTQGSF